MQKTLSSDYLDLEYYEKLWTTVTGWREHGEIPENKKVDFDSRVSCTDFLNLEARLADQNRLSEWVDLFTLDCVYWVPADVTLNDPRETVSWEIHDRRRLEERCERLDTGVAYSQLPATRTVHNYGNFEFMKGDEDQTVHVMCNFSINTKLGELTATRAGWNGFILRLVDGKWKIVLKRINLFDADFPQQNNSFTL